MLRSALPFVTLALAAGASAQNSFIVPSVLPGSGASTATTRGNSQDGQTFWFSSTPVQPVRTQMFWDVNDIPVPAAVLTSIMFRRSNAITNSNPSATAQVLIDMTVGPNTIASRSSTFANNRGGMVTTAFNGTVNLPPEASSGPGPAPFNVQIPFTNPFVYAAAGGNTLVADVTITSYTPTSANQTWYLDALATDAGIRTTNLNPPPAPCRFSNGVSNNAIGHNNPVLGGNWVVNYQSGSTTRIPTGLPAIGFMGFVGVGGIWNGIPLPFSLTPAGAPGCSIAVGLTLGVVLTEIAGGGIYTWPNIPVPNDPALLDGSFYDQGIFIDPPANPLGVFTSWSSKWTIRSGQNPVGASVYQYISNGSPVPSPTTGFSTTTATIAQFTY